METKGNLIIKEISPNAQKISYDSETSSSDSINNTNGMEFIAWQKRQCEEDIHQRRLVK